jgi:hypothetical protein
MPTTKPFTTVGVAVAVLWAEALIAVQASAVMASQRAEAVFKVFIGLIGLFTLVGMDRWRCDRRLSSRLRVARFRYGVGFRCHKLAQVMAVALWLIRWAAFAVFVPGCLIGELFI